VIDPLSTCVAPTHSKASAANERNAISIVVVVTDT
jgi:hypothetical protein